MRKIILSAFGCFLVLTTIAQQPQIAVVTATNSNSFYTSLATAISLAPAGSIIYLPGGNFSESVVVDKQLTIIGVGHNPDSNYVTNPTSIENITFTNGSNGAVIDGVSVSQYIRLDNADGIAILRCHCKGVVQNNNTISKSLSVDRCVMDEGITIGEFSDIDSPTFKNSIIGYIYTYTGSAANHMTFKNCIFLNGAYIAFDTNNRISSCIFMNAAVGVGILSSNDYQSNIFSNSEGSSGCINGQNGTNNKFDQTAQQTFVKQSGNVFSYYNDYQLKASSPGKNAGIDGKDIGIYGGTAPWVDGSLPPNPHIRSKEISQTTGTDGKLPVKFTITLPTP